MAAIIETIPYGRKSLAVSKHTPTSKQDGATSSTNEVLPPPSEVQHQEEEKPSVWSSKSFSGSLWRNFLASILPALYVVLSRLWLAEINPEYVALTGAWTYVGAISNVINEGLPRAAWRVVGDRNTYSTRQRYGFALTLISFISALAVLLTVFLLVIAPWLVQNLVPGGVRADSILYIRLGSLSHLFLTITNVLSICTRALDEPDVPLGTQSAQFVCNIVLDMLIISRFRVWDAHPTLNTQATIGLVCNAVSCLVAVTWFLWLARRRAEIPFPRSGRDYWRNLLPLLKVGWPLQAEAIPRDILSVWLGAMLLGISFNFASAYGIFFTIRLAILSAPAQAIEASCYTFVGHAWGKIAARHPNQETRVTWLELREVFRIIFISAGLMAVLEIVIYVVFAFRPGFQWALWFSAGQPIVANLEVEIWRRVNWGWTLVFVYLQLTSILMIAKPTWFLCISLVAFLIVQLPILLSAREKFLQHTDIWTYFTLSTAVPYLALFMMTLVVTAIWARQLLQNPR